MRTPHRVWQRLERLDADRRKTDLLQLAQHVATDLSFSVDELLAEAKALTIRCRAAGASIREARCALLANDLSLSVDEIMAELQASQERFA